MFVVKSGVNSGIFVVFFVIEHFLAINLSTKEVLLYEINIRTIWRHIHNASGDFGSRWENGEIQI